MNENNKRYIFDEVKAKSGIYKITNLVNDKIYIGQSQNIQERWNGHLSKLRLNKHDNQHLQKAWNKYGEENFSFEVIEFIENKDKEELKKILTLKEEYYCDLYEVFNRNKGYNMIKPKNSYTINSYTNFLSEDDIKKGEGFLSYNQCLEIGKLLSTTDMYFTEIAKKVSISERKVRKIYHRELYQTFFEKYVFVKRDRHRNKEFFFLQHKDYIIQELAKGKTLFKLSEELGLKYTAMKKYCNKYNIVFF